MLDRSYNERRLKVRCRYKRCSRAYLLHVTSWLYHAKGIVPTKFYGKAIRNTLCVATSKPCTTSNHRPLKTRFTRRRFSSYESSVASTNHQRQTNQSLITQLMK